MRAISPEIEARLHAALAKVRAAKPVSSPELCDETPFSVAIRPADCFSGWGTDGNSTSYSDAFGGYSYVPTSQPVGPITPTTDGSDFTDSQGNMWAYDPTHVNPDGSYGQWLKVIAVVNAIPSALHSYAVAYDGINALNSGMNWFLMFALGPEDLEASASMDRILARFGPRGVVALETRLLNLVLRRIIDEVGIDNIVNLSASDANRIMADAGYTFAPFSAEVNAAEVTTTVANATGTIGGQQLVRVSNDAVSPGGSFLTTLDQISNTDGSLMSATEIQNKLGLQYLPTVIVNVTEVTPGTQLLAGVAAGQPQWGVSGGGFQYFVMNGSTVRFGPATNLGY